MQIREAEEVRPFPFKSCPLVPRGVVGTPALVPALDRPIRDQLDRMAARVGLRPCKITEASLGRFLPGLPEPLLATVLREEEIAWLDAASARRARQKVARRHKADLLRAIGAGSRGWRRRRLYADPGGRPACLLSWLADTMSHDLAADYLWEVAEVAEVWGMEVHLRPTLWWWGPCAYGIEMCKPGRSILTFGEREGSFEWERPQPEIEGYIPRGA